MTNQSLPPTKKVSPRLHDSRVTDAWRQFHDRYGAYTRTAVSSLPALVLVFVMTACASGPLPIDSVTSVSRTVATPSGTESYEFVDCLLPGQIRQLGTHMAYVTERREVRTTKEDCTIRGGEQVSKDPVK